MSAPKKDEMLKLADELESGYFIQISALDDIAMGVAMLLRAEAERKEAK